MPYIKVKINLGDAIQTDGVYTIYERNKVLIQGYDTGRRVREYYVKYVNIKDRKINTGCFAHLLAENAIYSMFRVLDSNYEFEVNFNYSEASRSEEYFRHSFFTPDENNEEIFNLPISTGAFPTNSFTEYTTLRIVGKNGHPRSADKRFVVPANMQPCPTCEQIKPPYIKCPTCGSDKETSKWLALFLEEKANRESIQHAITYDKFTMSTIRRKVREHIKANEIRVARWISPRYNGIFVVETDLLVNDLDRLMQVDISQIL